MPIDSALQTRFILKKLRRSVLQILVTNGRTDGQFSKLVGRFENFQTCPNNISDVFLFFFLFLISLLNAKLKSC